MTDNKSKNKDPEMMDFEAWAALKEILIQHDRYDEMVEKAMTEVLMYGVTRFENEKSMKY